MAKRPKDVNKSTPKGSSAPANGSASAGLAAVVLVIAALAAIDPFGFWPFGPIRWLLLPVAGFVLAATTSGIRSRLNMRVNQLWLVLLGWGAVCALFGDDQLGAWFGSADRRLGWLSWLLFFFVFLAGQQIGAQHADARRTGLPDDSSGVGPVASLMKGVVVGGLLLALYSVAELLGLSALLVSDAEFASGRLGGTFGQPAYLGAAAALCLPVCVGFTSAATDRWKLAAGVASGGLLFCLLASQSRAAWLGIIASLAMVLWRFRSIAKSAKGLAAVAGSAVAFGLVLLVTPLSSRLTTAFGSNGVIAGRVDEWAVGMRAVGASPLLGYGPEGYRTVFGRHVDEAYVTQWGRDVITDRAHSGPVDVSLAFGIPGGLMYGALLVFVLLACWRSRNSGPLMFGLVVGLSAYIVQGLFLFPLAEIEPLFWLMAGILIGALEATQQQPTEQQKMSARPNAVWQGLAFGAAALSALAGGLDYVAGIQTQRALEQAGAATSPETLAVAQDTIANAQTLRPDSVRYVFVASRIASNGGQRSEALAIIEEGLVQNPADPALLDEQASLLLALAREASGPDRAELLANTDAAALSLLDRDPNNPKNLERLGITRALRGEFASAVSFLEQAQKLDPSSTSIGPNLDEAKRLLGSNS